MPALPEDALHPLGTCAGCRRVMLRKGWRGDSPEGAVRFFARDCCARCWHRRRADRWGLSRDERARLDARNARNAAALEAYLRGRRARQRKAARRALMEGTA